MSLGVAICALHWARLISGSELAVKIVNMADSFKVLFLREQPKPAKHVSFDPTGSHIAVSCTDGIVYVYRLSTEEPELVRKVDGLIRNLEIESESSSRAIWHPDGRAFAAPTATRDVQVVSSGDGERQRAFAGGHMGDVTALAWSPNGALLITAASDRKILLWDTKTQKVLARYDPIRLGCERLSLISAQLRPPKCHQHGLASSRQSHLFCNVRWGVVYLCQFSSTRLCISS